MKLDYDATGMVRNDAYSEAMRILNAHKTEMDIYDRSACECIIAMFQANTGACSIVHGRRRPGAIANMEILNNLAKRWPK